MKRIYGIFDKGFTTNLARKSAVLGLTGGGLFLTHQLYLYEDLKDQVMQAQLLVDQPDSPQKESLVDADKKEWIILGRQSPDYAKDLNATPKAHIYQKINLSSLFIKRLGAILDNEEHYELFEGSDFRVRMCSSNADTPQIIVHSSKMESTELKDISPDERFEIGFARKQGFADITRKSPFFHSSIALRRVPEGAPDNEDAVILTGKEIAMLIEATNNSVCQAQHCTFIDSNCYSASTFAMSHIITIIDKRHASKKKKSADIAKVFSVLSKIVFDNFSVGVCNNSVVKDEIGEAIKVVRKHHLTLETVSQKKSHHKT